MVKESRCELRRERREQIAVEACIERKLSVRKSASQAHLPKSTLQYRITKKKAGPNAIWRRAGRAPDLIGEEEDILVQWLQEFGDTGYPLTRLYLLDAVEELVANMPMNRPNKLQFKNGRPGKTWLRNFQERHKSKLRFGRASKQEAVRFRATNADTITTHFVSWEAFCKLHNLEAKLIFNTDENGMTPGKDIGGTTSKRTYTRSSVRAQQSQPLFKNCNRWNNDACDMCRRQPRHLYVYREGNWYSDKDDCRIEW